MHEAVRVVTGGQARIISYTPEYIIIAANSALELRTNKTGDIDNVPGMYARHTTLTETNRQSLPQTKNIPVLQSMYVHIIC